MPTAASKLILPVGYGAAGGEGTGQTTAGARPDDPIWTNIVKRFHPVWRAKDLKFRWLMDSWVAGEEYINGVYGYERDSYLPVRNLVRHPREYPDPQKWGNNQTFWGAMGVVPTGFSGAETALGLDASLNPFGPMPGYAGSDPHSTAHDDDYEYRRSRTVPPNFVGEAVEVHLGKIYDQEIRRDGPPDLTEWWKDVDGRGTPMDDWMREKVAPLLLVLGCLDILLDHPRVPAGETIATRADELRLGLDRCVATYILPQNMVWWRLDTAGRYVRCLVREYADPSERLDTDDRGNPIDPDYPENGPNKKLIKAARQWRDSYVRWRYWTAEESVLLNHNGDKIIERTPHRFGMVPIVRLIHRLDPKADNMGLSEYETIARYMRAYYNLDSELVLSNSQQAHPFLSGAEDFCKADNTLSVGPGYVLPMKKNPDSGQYQGWEFVSPPKDPAESLRKDKQDIRDAVDRDACLGKPAGAHAGHNRSGVVAQSGISKEMDAHTGHKKLTGLAKTLSKAERFVSEYALMVFKDTPVTQLDKDVRESIRVAYPPKFELRSATESTNNAILFQQFLAGAGDVPMAEAMTAKAIFRLNNPGLTDEEYDVFDQEFDMCLETKARLREQYREGLQTAGISDGSEVEGSGSTEQAAESDQLGQSNQTSVSGVTQMAV